jgi:hypothetical protein
VSRSRSELQVVIASDRLGARVNGAWREEAMALTGDTFDVSNLVALLKSAEAPALVRICLSPFHAPVWRVPAPPVRLTRNEMQGWVNEVLAQRFGELLQRWQLCWDYPPPEQDILVSAIEKSTIRALQQAVEGCGKRLVSIEPWLVSVMRASQREWSSKEYWLGVVEPGRVSLARISERGQPVMALLSQPLSNDNNSEQEIRQAIDRQTVIDPSLKTPHVWLLDLSSGQASYPRNAGDFHYPKWKTSALELMAQD